MAGLHKNTYPVFIAKFSGKVAHGLRKKLLDFCGNPNLDPDPGILTTLVNGHTSDWWVMFDQFNLHAQLPEITCLRLQLNIIHV